MGVATLAIAEGTPPGLIWIGLGLLVLSLILPMLRRSAQKKDPTPRLSREREQEVRKTLDDVFLQLQEFSRETMGKLDTRIRMLNQLIVDADERIRRLQSLPPLPTQPLAAAPAPQKLAPSEAGRPQSGPGRVEAPPPPPKNPIHDRIWRLLDGGASIGDVSREVGLPKGEVELIAGLRGLPDHAT